MAKKKVEEIESGFDVVIPDPIDPATDEVLIALKAQYFKLLPTERIGHTPELTMRLDKLEAAIEKRKAEL